MALLPFIVTISNTEDLAILSVIHTDTDAPDFAERFKHELRSAFNDPAFAGIATDFAVQSKDLLNEDTAEVVTELHDPSELIEISDAQQS